MNSFSPIGDSIKKVKKILPDISSLPEKDPDAHCDICDGYGHVIDESGARPCICVRKEIFNTEVVDARIPHRYAEESFDTFDARTPSLKACLARAREYVDHYSFDCPKGLYVHGPTGAGKTHLTVAILKGLIARGFNGVFYNIVDLLDNIRATFDPQMPSAPKNRLLQDFERQIFVLDDFGMQKTSTWVSDRLYSLINRRYQDCKTIIITSNISLNDLLLRVDNALSSRIIDMCEEIEIKAEDYRRLRTIKTHGTSSRRRSSTKSGSSPE